MTPPPKAPSAEALEWADELIAGRLVWGRIKHEEVAQALDAFASAAASRGDELAMGATRKGELGCPNCDGPCLGCWDENEIPSKEEADAILREQGLDPEEVGKAFAKKARELLEMMK